MLLPPMQPVPLAEVPEGLIPFIIGAAGAGFPSPSQDWQEDAICLIELLRLDRAASMTRPIRELKGFKKVRLPPGASTEVQFTLTRRELAFYNAQMQFVAEPGEFDVWIAPSASTGVSKRFELLAG